MKLDIILMIQTHLGSDRRYESHAAIEKPCRYFGVCSVVGE